jgi:hypothetical protein
LEEVITKLRVLTTYPATKTWIDAAHFHLLKQLAEVYLDWAESIADASQDPHSNESQLERGKAAVATALDLLTKHPSDWLPASHTAELRLTESVLLLELLDDDGAELALQSASEILRRLPEEHPALDVLVDRLEIAWQNLNDLRKAKSESEAEGDGER